MEFKELGVIGWELGRLLGGAAGGIVVSQGDRVKSSSSVLLCYYRQVA